jgi:hypothetical protein
MQVRDPYATPHSDVTLKAEGPQRIYSPWQAGAGAGLGGPLGLIYFLRANFLSLGKEESARKTVIYGLIFFVAVAVAILILPDSFPSFPFTVGYVVIAWRVAEQYQLSKQQIIDSPEYEFHSNWRVVGIGLLCAVASIAVLALPVLVLAWLGVIT